MRNNNEILMYKLVRSNEKNFMITINSFIEFYIAIISFSEIIAHFLNEFLHG